MKLTPRRRLFTIVLAILLAGVMTPSGLRAMNAHRQDTSSTTTTTTTKKHKKSKKASAESSTAKSANPAEAKNATTEAKTSKKSHRKSNASESAKETSSAPSAAPASKPESPAPAEAVTHSTSKSHATTAQAQTPPSPGMVWVNTSSKVYHKSGSRWYGKTKQGKWMTEADAQKAGYKAASN